MNKKKRMLQAALALGVIAVGLYMWWGHTWGTPPAISGVGFIMAGLALWVPHCPLMKMLLK
jgi:hypothetical protein